MDRTYPFERFSRARATGPRRFQLLPRTAAGRFRLVVLVVLLAVALGALFARRYAAAALRLGDVRLPPGFRIGIYAVTPGARSLALGDSSTVFVGTRGE